MTLTYTLPPIWYIMTGLNTGLLWAVLVTIRHLKKKVK